eukprot:180184_1
MPLVNQLVLQYTKLSFLVYTIHSCSMIPPPNGTLYVSEFQLLDDPDYILMRIETYTTPNINHQYYCKILNVNDGTVSGVVSCNDNKYTVRDWSSGDIDPTSTEILSATNNNDRTVNIILRRNNANIGITRIPYTYSNMTELYYDQFTVNSMYTTFVMLSPEQFILEIIMITFASATDNRSPKVKNLGSVNSWNLWDIEYSTPNKISVYENANTIQLPLICCLCYSNFLSRYYFNYDATSGEISGIEVDTNIDGGIVDAIGQKAYWFATLFATQIKVYDLENIGSSLNIYSLDLTYITNTPTTVPTQEPTFTTRFSTQVSVDSTQKESDNSGVIVGLVIGVIIGFVIIGIGCCYYGFSYRKKDCNTPKPIAMVEDIEESGNDNDHNIQPTDVEFQNKSVKEGLIQKSVTPEGGETQYL